jgi:hypothetical protein
MMKSKQEIESTLGKKMTFKKVFPNTDGTFSAHSDACSWLEERGLDVGSMQRGYPIGVARNADIAKWTNLVVRNGGGTVVQDDRRLLDGVMLSDDWREGSVVVLLENDPEAKT